MIALDTNILVRFFVRDDEAQAMKARALINASRVLVLATVLMETEWVLRSRYGFSRERISAAFADLCGLNSVILDQPLLIERGLAAFAADMDFADALHLAGSDAAETFATFDADLARKATDVSGFLPVVAP